MLVGYVNGYGYYTMNTRTKKEWMNKFDGVKNFVNTNQEMLIESGLDTVGKWINIDDSKTDASKIKSHGRWVLDQHNKYGGNTDGVFVVKNDNIITDEFTNIWQEFEKSDVYKNYFSTNIDRWNSNMTRLVLHIETNNKLPSESSKDKEIALLRQWINNQIKKTNVKTDENKQLQAKWIEFSTSDKYKKYFLNAESDWVNKLSEYKTYIDVNNTLPPRVGDATTTKLHDWGRHQMGNYHKRNQIMKNDEIYLKWEIFVVEYECYFKKNVVVKEILDKNKNDNTIVRKAKPILNGK